MARTYRAPYALTLLSSLMAAAAALFTTCHVNAQNIAVADWVGGTSSDFFTDANWNNGVQPSNLGGDITLVQVGVNAAVTSNVIDLGGGTTSYDVLGNKPSFNGSTVGFGDGSTYYAPFRFGENGGHSEYTIQNGTIQGDPDGGHTQALLHVEDNLTVNWDVAFTDNLGYIDVGAGSTLNIGPNAATSGSLRGSFMNGGEPGTSAVVNIDAPNYANGGLVVGTPGNANSYSRNNLTVNFRADRIGNGWIQVFAAEAGNVSTVVINNNATVQGNGGFSVESWQVLPLSAEEQPMGVIQIGDAETPGSLISTRNDRLLLGRSNRPVSSNLGCIGVLDIVNGLVSLTGDTPTKLGYGRNGGTEINKNSTGIINIHANGLLVSQAGFVEPVGTVQDDDGVAHTGIGIFNFDGGTLRVSDEVIAENALNFVEAGIEVNILDGGMVLHINAGVDAVGPEGDFNGDNTVNLADYTVWRDNLGGDETSLAEGSSDGSTIVDTGDYDLWKTNFGNVVSEGALGAVTIPAPLLGTGTGGLTVQGGGELTLTGANTYVGDTIVDASTLSITTAYLADGASVDLLGDSILDLAFAGTDDIAQLLFDGVAQAAGTWGALGSGAEFEDARITGSGLLMVNTAPGALASVTAVPEPSSAMSALAMLLVGAGFTVRRRA